MTTVLIGFCILLPLAPEPDITSQIGPCYLAVMLICIGQYPTNPAGSAWISGNLAGDTKRAMGIALNICLGNTGGIVGSVRLSMAPSIFYDTDTLRSTYFLTQKRIEAIRPGSALALRSQLSPSCAQSVSNFLTGRSTSPETSWTKMKFDDNIIQNSWLAWATRVLSSDINSRRRQIQRHAVLQGYKLRRQN